MSDPQPRDKVEEEKPKEFKKTAEYRRFKRLLRQVVKAPPMPRKPAHEKAE